jgi:hypothetical protein
VGGLAREISIKVSPYGTLLQCCTRSSGQVRRNLRAIGPLSKCVSSGATCKENRHNAVTSYGTLVQCCTRSAGQVRRSLLSIGPLLYKCSIRLLARLCVLLLYLTATRRISSVMLSMWRSLWSSWLLTYQGAFTIVLRNFDWKRWSSFNLVGLAQPHNWTPYDQMYLRTTLYRSNLLFRDNLELRPRSQCICLNLISSCLLFAGMCVCQVSRRSRWRPRYLNSVATVMGELLNVKGGHVFLRFVNVTCTDG